MLIVLVTTAWAGHAFAQAPASDSGATGRDADAEPFAASFSSAVAALPGDLWRSLAIDSAAIVGTGLAAAALAHPGDRATLDEVQEHAWVRDGVRPGNALGSGWVQTGGALAAGLLGHWTGRPRLMQTGLDVLRTQLAHVEDDYGLDLQALVAAIPPELDPTRFGPPLA